MKTLVAKNNSMRRTDRTAVFLVGICTGLVLAYVVSVFGHRLPAFLLYSAFGGIIVAAWIPVKMIERWTQPMEDYTLEVVEGERRGFFASCVRGPMLCLSKVYMLRIRARRARKR